MFKFHDPRQRSSPVILFPSDTETHRQTHRRDKQEELYSCDVKPNNTKEKAKKQYLI